MRTFQQSMDRTRTKLPAGTFDGTNLHITTYRQLKSVESFLKNYKVNLGKAIKSWNRMIPTARTRARRANLVQRQTYFRALLSAYLAKAKTIKKPVVVAPKAARVIKLSEVFVGPDAGKTTPYLVDMLGPMETLFRAWGTPGSTKRPSRWYAKLRLYVHYPNVASDDVLKVQLLQRGRRLGAATTCRMRGLYKNLQLAYFECKSPDTRDKSKQRATSGAHVIKLSYKKPVEGKTFKNFATLRVNVLKIKHGSRNRPTRMWATDHDMRLHVTTIEEKFHRSSQRTMVRRVQSAVMQAFRDRRTPSFLEMRTWFKWKDRAPRMKATCFYKGKRISEASAIGGDGFKYWTYARRGKDSAHWRQARFALGHIVPRALNGKRFTKRGYHYLDQNPGKYRCVITGDGDILKEVFFTVGAEGELVKSACQLKSMNTLRTITLVRTKDRKVSDRSYNKHIGKKRAFAGRVAWARGCPLH